MEEDAPRASSICPRGDSRDKMHTKTRARRMEDGGRREAMNRRRKDGKGIPPEGSLTDPTCVRASSTHNASRVRKQNTGYQGNKPVDNYSWIEIMTTTEWK